MISVLDVRTALHVLKSWARQRIEERQSVSVVVDGDVMALSPCHTKGDEGWTFQSNHRSWDRSSATAEALGYVERCEAVLVPRHQAPPL
jgi:hypothetical protein